LVTLEKVTIKKKQYLQNGLIKCVQFMAYLKKM